MTTPDTRTRPKLIPYKEFVEQSNCIDYGKANKLVYFGYNDKDQTYQFRIAFKGKKELVLKDAYRLLFLEEDDDDREIWIDEGTFKIAISFNFTGARSLPFSWFKD